MRSSTTALAVHHRRSRRFDWRAVFVSISLACSLAACAHQSPGRPAVSDLPPLRYQGGDVTVAEAASRVPDFDLLSLDAPMREFVARYAGMANRRQRLHSLHTAVRGAGNLDLQYDPFAEGSAQEVFHRGSANCLSYANLFVALAREAGLDARYQRLEVRPQWSKVSDLVQVGMHVNVVVELRDGTRFMVDIDPPPSRRIAGSTELSDAEAKALYYNNIAMDALAHGDPGQAWSYLVRALVLSPDTAQLWVNVGAIYRQNGQPRAAERSYLAALELDPEEYSAMTNLAVLYGMEGRDAERDHYSRKVEGHRARNPYYHAWQGDEAAAAGDWTAALGHYNRAIELLPSDSHLLYARGLIHYQLNNLDPAARDISRAIEQATLHSDIELYQMQLDEVRRAGLANL